jgi:hypothetical protein
VCGDVWFCFVSSGLAVLPCFLVWRWIAAVMQAKCYHGREFVFGAGGHDLVHCNPPQDELSEVDIKTFATLFSFQALRPVSSNAL